MMVNKGMLRDHNYALIKGCLSLADSKNLHYF